MQLTSSWCSRSGWGSGGEGGVGGGQGYVECSRQWASKVQGGKLGLHEKVMRACNQTVGACPAGGGGLEGGGGGECGDCLGVVGDLLFEMRTHRLGLLRSTVLRTRKGDVADALEDTCQNSFNRHVGDATGGPARSFHRACEVLLDQYHDQVVASLIDHAGPLGLVRLTSNVAILQRRICVQVSRMCDFDEMLALLKGGWQYPGL